MTAGTDLRSLFCEALDRPTALEQTEYLDQACAGQPALRARVEALLRAHREAVSFLGEPSPGSTGSVDLPDTERPGTMIGPYKLLEKIGEGGMGVVYVAEQQHPVRRRVALKIIKPGMDSRQVIARFETERQTLAMMDHPNIAKVFDGGAIGDLGPHAPNEEFPHAEGVVHGGRPYFVMELVKGAPITEYCDAHRLTTRQRLTLFLDVSLAVQHAHQKGIIHRDLKPSNVMVTVHDVIPVVKVIDFGIAKAIVGQRFTDKSVYTAFAQLIGTPMYMSPEQAGLSGLDVDTRSDVYSLGVLLYELLTGTTPFDDETLKKAGFDEMRRIIREDEPLRPSSRLSTMQQAALSTIADRRGLEPKHIRRHLRGELDWIVMRALEKDRNRRYESASAFAADVQRYLDDEPVQACPPSAGYRLRKFACRNRGPVIAVAMVLLALVGGVIGTTWGMAWAIKADNATRAEVIEKDKAKTKAEEEAAIATSVNGFLLNDLLAEAEPENNPRSKKVTVEELLGRAAVRIDGKFENQPLVEAAIRMTIGHTYRRLGNFPSAQPHLERALELRRSVLGEEHSDTLWAINNVALNLHDLGQLDEAETLSVKLLEVHRRVLGEEHPTTLSSANNLARTYLSQGHAAKAEPLFVNTLEVRRRVLGEEHPSTLTSMNNLAFLYQNHGQAAKAEQLYVQALESRRRIHGEDHPQTLTSMNNLARLYQAQGKSAEAEPLFVKAVEVSLRVLGDDHSNTLQYMINLANLYKDKGQFAKAEPLYVKALEVRSRLSEEGPGTLELMNNLAFLYMNNGRFAKAESLYLETLEIHRRASGEEHPNTLTVMHNLGGLYESQRQLAKAEPLWVKTLELRRRVLGEEDPDTVQSVRNLAALYQNQGQLAKADPLLREALDKSRKLHGEASAPYASALAALSSNLVQMDKPAEAEPLLRQCLAFREKNEADAWNTFNTKSMLGATLLARKSYAEAEPLLVEGYEGMKQREGKMAPPTKDLRLRQALERLAQLYDAWGRKEKADEWRTKLEGMKKAPDKAAVK